MPPVARSINVVLFQDGFGLISAGVSCFFPGVVKLICALSRRWQRAVGWIVFFIVIISVIVHLVDKYGGEFVGAVKQAGLNFFSSLASTSNSVQEI